MIDRSSGVPAYRQVALALREEIESGERQPGEKLPSERELVDAFGVSRPTIRDAVSLLRAEGLVTAEHGKGVFIKPPSKLERLSRGRLSKAARAADKGAFLGDAVKNDFTPSVSVKVLFEPANQEFADIFGIDLGDEITVRDRVMRANGLPVQLAVSRLPRSITNGTPVEEVTTGPGGMYARLEESGYPLERFTETVSTRMPTPDEASMLQLAPGTPLLCVRRTAFTTKDRAIETNDMRLSGDRYELGYEWPAE